MSVARKRLRTKYYFQAGLHVPRGDSTCLPHSCGDQVRDESGLRRVLCRERHGAVVVRQSQPPHLTLRPIRFVPQILLRRCAVCAQNMLHVTSATTTTCHHDQVILMIRCPSSYRHDVWRAHECARRRCCRFPNPIREVNPPCLL